jgi:hypothetical protein
LGWFVQSSARIQAFREAAGGRASLNGMEDVNMDAEMQAMMGGEGKTTGQRNEMLQNALPIKLQAIQGSEATRLRHLADRIISAKKQAPAADTSALEREIDQQVYAL